LQVRELAATTLAGLMKGAGSKLGESFRKEAYDDAVSLLAATKGVKRFVCFKPFILIELSEYHNIIVRSF
jgi:hypothetical protein